MNNILKNNPTADGPDNEIDLSDIFNDTKVQTEKKLSPVEEELLKKQSRQQGQVYTDTELADGLHKLKTDLPGSDDRTKFLQQELTDHDLYLNKRNYVILIKPLPDKKSWLECYNEIDDIVIDENGIASYATITNPVYTRIRKPDEPLFNWNTAPNYSNNSDPISNNIDTTDVTDNENTKKKVVEILIDKTGLGATYDFTPDENKSIETADLVRIKEVKIVDIRAMKFKKSDKSFHETISAFDYRGTRVPMWFPASGFRAEFKGFTYGEYTDIAIAIEKQSFDNYHKMLSIIYNKMVNPSCGDFKDFEDFIKHFAYTDVPLAIYAIFMATEDTEQDIKLECGAEKCHKQYNYHYNTHSILKYDKCSDLFLQKFLDIQKASGDELLRLYDESEVNNIKVIQLPKTEYYFAVGIISAYDYLYNFTPLTDENILKDLFGGKEPEDAYINNIALLTAINAVYLPDGTEFTNYKDILDAIYSLSPTDMSILVSYANEAQTSYIVTFSFDNAVCPHCGHKTKSLDFNIEDLVFQKYLTLTNTTVDVRRV